MHVDDDAPRPRADKVVDLAVDAFSTFYRATRKHLIGFLVLHDARLDDAVDIADDTLCRAYEDWSDIRNPRAWVFTVARRTWSRQRFAREQPTSDFSDVTNPVSQEFTGWEADHELLQVLGSLPARQREVMALSFFGFSYAEIEEIIGINADTVRSNVRHARRAIRAYLTEERDR